jgi:hypothetical protein
MKGPSLEGDLLDNFKLILADGGDGNLLLDDFEILR